MKGYIILKHTEFLLKSHQVSSKTSESVPQKSRISSTEFSVQERMDKTLNKGQITKS